MKLDRLESEDLQESVRQAHKPDKIAVVVKASPLSTPVELRRHLKNSSPQWDREVLEDGHIRDGILNNVQQLMRGAGLSFVAGQKKKPTNIDCWALRSKKLDKDKIYEMRYFRFHFSVLGLPIAMISNRSLCITVHFRANTTAIVLSSCVFLPDFILRPNDPTDDFHLDFHNLKMVCIAFKTDRGNF
jgi:hypothetical protein